MPRVTISEPGKTPQPYRFKLERKTINIGRGSDNDIVIECASVSTRHSILERVEGGYILRDKGSTNGIKQEDTQMDIIDLYDGMEVLVGDIPLKFQLSKEEIQHLSDENFTTHQRRTLPKMKDDEEAPQREPKPASTASPRSSHRAQPQVAQSGGSFKTLAVFVLMIIAVFGGMTLRHYKETNQFLPTKLMGGKEDAPPTKPAEQDHAEEEETPAAE